MSFNRSFPNQHVFKRPKYRELEIVINEKEAAGWELVKPPYKESVVNKSYISDKNFRNWSYSGDNEVVKWVGVMKRKEE